MRKRSFIVLMVGLAMAFLVAGIVSAKEKSELKKDEPKKDVVAVTQAALPETTAQQDTAKQEKDLLIANVNNMRDQELRVAVLQQLLNEEVLRLRNSQALFCDRYKLDVDKFRSGLYRYDEKQGKFIEASAEEKK